MNYCSKCGGPVTLRVPAGENRPRFVCEPCGTIHYENPRLVVGCIPDWQGKVLMVRRAIEPRYGMWTLPAGFLENGETVAEGASREVLEEAGARVENLAPYAMFDLPFINQVHLMFRSELSDIDHSAGAESLEVKLFDEEEIPWNEIAFPVASESLRYYFTDRLSGGFRFRLQTVPPLKIF